MNESGEIGAHGLVTGHRDRVRSEWIDYNGHMNVAYYVLAFDRATDHFAEQVGLGPDYRARNHASFFVVDMNVTYKREVAEGAPLLFTTQLLDHDDKRLHFFHRMYHAEEGGLAATNELLAVHVDMAARRSAPFAERSILETLARMRAAQATLDPPPEAGRALGIRRG